MIMKTVKENFGVGNNIGWRVNIHYDVWDSPGSTHREQKSLIDVDLEEFIEKYGDWIYEGWYTTGNHTADMWVGAAKPYCYNGNEVEINVKR